MDPFLLPKRPGTIKTNQVRNCQAAVTDSARLRVALFITCFNDTLFPATGRAVVALLERLGHEVVFPDGQTCCGQMHGNTGYAEHGDALARRLEHTFEGESAIVSPSASCVGFVREHVPSMDGRLFELTEFLVDRLGVEDVGASFPHRVTLHPTCHSLRLLRVGDRPARLLSKVHGIDLVELGEAEECCGFGGTFAVKNADTSMAMLGDKLRRVLDTRAEVCTAADNSCLMHIGGALRRQRAGVRTMHLAEILAAQE
jgi:L-lactate dehydrogenase complex protein LldE